MPGRPPDGLHGELAVTVGSGAEDDADVLGEFQPRAAARDTAPSSASPDSTAFTTSDSSRASHAPRASAACAYTCAVAKAISRA